MTRSAAAALDRLRAGNRRFVSGQGQLDDLIDERSRLDLVEGQEPFAVILGCSDSRVPVEIIFDHGLGDLFVIRVAGNIVASSQVGSVEFAVEQFGSPLVVVLGHTRCGAIQATLDQLRDPTRPPTPGLSSIVDRIRPAFDGLLSVEVSPDPLTLLKNAVRANVVQATRKLHDSSELLADRVRSGDLLVVGAEYQLETGVVDFFEGLPDEG